MSWFFFTWSGVGGWKQQEAENKDAILQGERPVYSTILEVNNPCEDKHKVPDDLKYRGPMYFDWDNDPEADDAASVNKATNDLLDDVRVFIRKLESMQLDPATCRWYLTGGRGVHCIIPPVCIMDVKQVSEGVKDLPLIYKDLAFKYATEFTDLRVYTGKRGRMWRTTFNPRQRPDGTETWKVPVSVEELKTLNAEKYWMTCSEQREEPPIVEPVPNRTLRTDFLIAYQNISKRIKEKPKNTNVLREWKDKTPATIEAAFRGEHLLDKMGLNDIKIQFALAAIATGVTDTDKYIEMVDGFIESRIGKEGATHRTRGAIENELRKGFDYLVNDYSYCYTPHGFASILDKEVKDNLDLRGVDSSEENKEEFSANVGIKLAGAFVADTVAVLKLSKDGAEPISDYTWKESSLQLVKRNEEEIVEYSVVPVVGGKEMKRISIAIQTLLSPTKMIEHIAKYGGTAHLSSSKDAVAFRKSLLNFVGEESDAPEVMITQSEGLHVVPLEDGDLTDPDLVNMYWVESNAVIGSPTNKAETTTGKPVMNLIYKDYNNPDGRIGIDLSEAIRLEDAHVDMKRTVDSLLQVNGNTFTLGVLLGWFAGCLIKHPLYVVGHIKTFPLLQVVGQAGSGKTTVVNMLLNLFSFKKEYEVKPAGKSLSPFAFESMVSGSTSVPIVLDEFKYQNLARDYINAITAILQNGYTIGLKSTRGGGGTEAGGGYQTLTGSELTAPIGLMSETVESSQTSIMERSVVATFNKASIAGRREQATFLLRNNRNISILGRGMLDNVMITPPSKLVELHLKNEKEIEDILYEGGNDRIVNNAIMVLTGFDWFAGFIRMNFGSEFDGRLDAIRESLVKKNNWVVSVTTEVARMLNWISLSSHYPEHQRVRAELGFHYAFMKEEYGGEVKNMLVLSADRVFGLYRELMSTMKLPPAFNSPEDLHHALINSVSAVEGLSHPKLGSNCIKFDPDMLAKEKVDAFRT